MSLSKIAVKRLTILADFMDAFPKSERKLFDMEFYERKTACGTVMCAAGWAAQVPSFKKAGLFLMDEQYFFHIKISDWRNLFSPCLRKTIKSPTQWAAHCRKYIKKNS